MKKNISILDCTLRDGGYINNWIFGRNTITQIIQHLINAKIDFIECGYLKHSDHNNDKSFFPSLNTLSELISNINSSTKFSLMINYGEYNINDIPEYDNNIYLRVAFKKEKQKEAVVFCKQLIKKGYKIFCNPMHTSLYSKAELLDLINDINIIKPSGFSIVDTMGIMTPKDIIQVFKLINKNLDKNIALCFHSHNNLQLSFTNTQTLIEICKDRKLIIDSTLFGMGRGVGNLCTEILVDYLNNNYNTRYEISPILKAINEQIKPIYTKTPWGYSVPYYLAAKNHCHPNYAKFLIEKQSISLEQINNVLKTIPKNKKTNFEEAIITQVYKQECLNFITNTQY